MPKPTLDDTLPLRALAHLANAGSPQSLGDLALVLRLNSTQRLQRILAAMVNAGLVRHKTGRLPWSNGKAVFTRSGLAYSITAKGSKAFAAGKVPTLTIEPARRPQPLSSTATPLRRRLREKVLAFLSSTRHRASLAEVVTTLAVPNASDTIRFVLEALAAEGIVRIETVEMAHRWNHPAGELVHSRPTRVYSLVKPHARR